MRWPTRRREYLSGRLFPPPARGRFAAPGAVRSPARPETHAASSLDHLVGPREHRPRDSESERLRRLEVDDEIELGGLLHGQIGRLGALDDLVHVASGAPE